MPPNADQGNWNLEPEARVSLHVAWIRQAERLAMVKFLLWCILLVFCWPLALLVLVLYPFIWLLLLPFRVLGIAVDGVFDLLGAILRLPGRLIRAI